MTKLRAAGVAVLLSTMACAGPPHQTGPTGAASEGSEPAEESVPVRVLPRESHEEPGPTLASPPLVRFFEALRDVEDGVPGATAVALQIGDSHTASDTLTGELRDVLQLRFGDGGRGLSVPGRPWSAFRQESMTATQSEGWVTTVGVRADATSPLALTGVRLDATGVASIGRGACPTCRVGSAFDVFSAHVLIQPGGGTVEIAVGPEVFARESTMSDVVDVMAVTARLPEGAHEVEVRAVGDGPVSIVGVATDRTAGGVRWESPGLNGATVWHWLDFDAALVSAEVALRSPDLVAIAFGTNEAWGDAFRFEPDPAAGVDGVDAVFELEQEAVERYAVRTVQLLDTLRAGATAAGCLVILPPDFHDRREPCVADPAEAGFCERMPPRALGLVRDGLLRAADRSGCAVWDIQAAMGGPGSHSRWQALDPPLARDDGVHLSALGYDVVGAALAADLLAAWDDWRSGGDGRLMTRPIILEQP